MQKSFPKLDYFFRMKINQLHILSNYGQLKEMIQVYGNFMKASVSDQIIKMKELSEE